MKYAVHAFFEQLAQVDVSKILVGNKSDEAMENRRVTYDEGMSLAEEYDMDFFEASAKSGFNVEKAFYTISTSIYKVTNFLRHIPCYVLTYF